MLELLHSDPVAQLTNIKSNIFTQKQNKQNVVF